MNRPYGPDLFRDQIETLKARVPSMAIGTDIIVGFPGEGEEEFRNTRRFAAALPISYFHVFNFSRRPGTAAAVMPDQVPADVRKRRSAKLIRLGNAKRRAFMRSCIGSSGPGIVQGAGSRFSRFARVLTGNYCEVLVRCPSRLDGALVPITVTHYSAGRLYGRLVESNPAERRSGIGEQPR
jgi:threonylcarbamoyladenosine tRNA methylthiotransferase MtaB